MGFGAILFGGRGVRTMLGFSWHAMAVFEEEFFDISWHGNIKPLLVVVPFEGDTAIYHPSNLL